MMAYCDSLIKYFCTIMSPVKLVFVLICLIDFNKLFTLAVDSNNFNNNYKNINNNNENSNEDEHQQIITLNKSNSDYIVSSDTATEENIKQWNNKYTPGDVRCYCNLPVCVATGYMCKSQEGGCFTDLLGGASDVFNARHGCLELLIDKDLKKQCQVEPNNNGWSRPQHPKSLLLCCRKDMCNHVDSPEARSKLNDTLMNSSLSGIENSANTVSHTNMHPTPSYSDAEVWFKAATIAVPICGVLILLMLIGLAVRILRSDANKLGGTFGPAMEYKSNVNHLVEPSHHHSVQNYVSVKKVPLIYSDTTTKSLKQFQQSPSACCQQNIDHIAPLLMQQSNTNNFEQTLPLTQQQQQQQSSPHYHQKNEMFAKLNTCKNVNIIPSTNHHHAKLYEKCSVPLSQ